MTIKSIFLAGSITLGLLASGASAEGIRFGDNAHLDELFTELQTPGGEKYQATEREIERIFRQSGSAAMDLLLARGMAALDAGNPVDAVWHFSALIDHAPEFAEGYNGRATAWFDMGEFGLAVDDIQVVLALNPRNFAALAGLGIISLELGKNQVALDAFQAAYALNPHFRDLVEAIEVVESEIGITH